MSKIEKLQILGIRSFGIKEAQNITFTAPLTLIVGWNGSGKTTIIECLKYATTGELPANSKTGGAFIHDPKLCGEKEVLAQVKISFRSTSNARMVATRRLQLTVKKATRSQKTLEGSLQIAQGGEKTSVSSRVAELDQLIPQYLGVSKAVLEFVIFCHQDDSLWPMSEPAVLKKRFDEIFEALKYTKAIENIKILRKKQNEELGKLKLIEQHAKEDKERGDRTEKKSTELFNECEVLRADVDELEEKVKEAKEKSTEAFNHAARYEQIVAQLNGKRITMGANQENAAALEDNLKHMAETDEELQSMLDQYEDRVSLYGTQQEDLRKQYGDFRNELEENRRSLGAKQSEIGKYQAQKEQHDRHLLQRENLVREAAKRHEIRGFDYEVTDKKVADFLEIIGKMSRDQNKTLDRARRDTQDELRKAQTGVNQLNERKSALGQRKDSSRSQITANDKRMADLQRTMDQIRIDEGGEAILQDKKNDTEQRLKTAKSEASSEQYDERIRELESTVRSLDEKKEHLDAELVDATRFARDSAQIEYAQDELKGTKHSLETMKKVHSSRISQLIDPDWDPSHLEATFEREVSLKATKVKEAESRRDIAQTNLNNVNFKISNLESEQKKTRAELQKYEQTVRDATNQDDLSDFEQNLRELEEQYELTTSDQAKIEAQLEYMKKCLEVAVEHDQCRLCKRTLRDDKTNHFSKASFISSLEAIVKKAQANLEGENTDELFAELESVRNAKPSYELAMRARNTEIPALQSEFAKLTSEREAINKQLEEQDSIVYDLQTSKQEIESLTKDVQSIVNYFNQARELETKIEDLAQKQKAAGMSRGIDAIQEDLKKIGNESRSAKIALTRLSAERDKLRNLMNTLELAIRDINADLNNAQSKLKEKRALVDRIEEFKTHNTEQREAIRGFDKQVQDLIPQIEQAQVKYDDINRRGSEQVQRLQEEASKLSDSVRQLSYAEQEINAYIDKGGPQQLSRTHREIENLEGDISRIDEGMVQVTRKLKKIEDTVRDTENTKRSISDNIRYRKAKRVLQALQVEIQELESHNAEHDRDRYEREGRKWQNELMSLTTKFSSVCTTLKAKDDQLGELMREWETEYRDAAFKYREAHIKVETTKAAVEDLGRYGGALDKAIMKYHTLKMEEINRIVEELWKEAYQGTDVDTIKIRSDNETAKGNRSYNYRVVMVKQETEMDMRGRCSAGQKVLASIVIRLALAECFGVNCGLIALDEPTTNLDQQNIKGLAESLSQIIQIRRKQANFQLIVITHDEQFLRDMNCADFTDVYWRVGRNEKQESVIERQQISEVA
ncbi:DNA repair protein-like protein rad50 [Melanomma pulvis-pyrius CBS 109.77]|uniref:DNA repair protein RAD50 n=1 Tax=Melanomma pulvis-pyrius CBS 109.77 TaxID=1314802 RepID=A0A6A6XQY3_9PLEO|nr:DNA repair protein-like protein rad50 [Melanomma pulvis-pyrius CBS 109.77]